MLLFEFVVILPLMRNDEKETQALVRQNYDHLSNQTDLMASVSRMTAAMTAHQQSYGFQPAMQNILESSMKNYALALET